MPETFLDKAIASGLAGDALVFVEGNYPTLLAIGQDAVTEILQKIKDGDHQAAKIVLERRLVDPDTIIQFELQNAKDLLTSNAAREKLIGEIEGIAESLLPTLIKIGIGAATGGLTL